MAIKSITKWFPSALVGDGITCSHEVNDSTDHYLSLAVHSPRQRAAAGGGFSHAAGPYDNVAFEPTHLLTELKLQDFLECSRPTFDSRRIALPTSRSKLPWARALGMTTIIEERPEHLEALFVKYDSIVTSVNKLQPFCRAFYLKELVNASSVMVHSSISSNNSASDLVYDYMCLERRDTLADLVNQAILST